MTQLDRSRPARAFRYPTPGETVIRHASAFRRDWPDPSPKEPVVQPAPELPAMAIDLDDLDVAARLIADTPTAARTAARNAQAARWRHQLAYACGRALGRPEVVSESVLLRAVRSDGFPWRTSHVAAVWRRTGGSGSWFFDVAWRWRREAGRVSAPAERMAAGELAWWLKTGGESTTNPRPPKKRRESAAVAAARSAIEGELVDA